MSGLTLDALLAQKGSLPQDEALRITSDVCHGLTALHRIGLVHRDINPNNFIIGQDGATTMIDFGITRVHDAKKHSDTAILGTPGYAAPEQFGFSQSDKRTDIYAVGVLMNVMMTGVLPTEKRPSGKAGRIIGKCVEVDSSQTI